ncbi:hypothetical protein M419DRAFT_118405, partial [Trichoderma reesei RUT C-30]
MQEDGPAVLMRAASSAAHLLCLDEGGQQHIERREELRVDTYRAEESGNWARVGGNRNRLARWPGRRMHG